MAKLSAGVAVVEQMRGCLGFGRRGAFGRRHRIAGGLGELILVGEEQGAPGLKIAYEYLAECVQNTLNSVDLDSTVSADKKATQKRVKLLAIRNKLLRLSLILVELDTEEDAYLIFETLNTRGKDLAVSDLVKNHISRLIRPKNKGVDVAKEKWQGIRDRFDASEAELDLNSFLHHTWLSRHPYLPERLHDIRLRWRCAEPCGCQKNPHDMKALDWGLLELARRDGWEKAKQKLEELANLKTHEFRLFMGNFRLHLKEFGIIGVWYPKIPAQRPLL